MAVANADVIPTGTSAINIHTYVHTYITLPTCLLGLSQMHVVVHLVGCSLGTLID